MQLYFHYRFLVMTFCKIYYILSVYKKGVYMNIGVSLPWPFISGLYTDEGSIALKKTESHHRRFSGVTERKGSLLNRIQALAGRNTCPCREGFLNSKRCRFSDYSTWRSRGKLRFTGYHAKHALAFSIS